jgi:membrane protein required for colicin V production
VNWLTVVLVLVIAWGTFTAWRTGFVRSLVTFCALILAIPIAELFYDDLYRKLHPIISNSDLAYLVSFLAIVTGVVIAGWVVAHVIRQGVAMLNLGLADSIAGGAFGFLRTALLCQVVLVALVAFPSPDLQGSIHDSAVARALLDAAPAVLAFLPGQFDHAIHVFLDGVQAAGGVLGANATPTPLPSP